MERLISKAGSLLPRIQRYLAFFFTHSPLDNIALIFRKITHKDDYVVFMKKYEPSGRELELQGKVLFSNEPTISIVVPLYNTPIYQLKDMIDSVLAQSYKNFELCLLDGNSRNKNVREAVKAYAKKDARIKYYFSEKNHGIAENTNRAISFSTGEYIGFLDHDDMLAPHALFEIVSLLNSHPEADAVYSDEDMLSMYGHKRMHPHFKPDFSPDLLRSNNYICHFFVVRRSIGDELGWLRSGFDGAQDHDFVLRVSEKTNLIFHIPKVLYHWRMSALSVAFNPKLKQYAYTAGKNAIKQHLERLGKKCVVSDGPILGIYKVSYIINEFPKVSIIIPSRDHAEDLVRCTKSILERTSYVPYEIIIMENGSVNSDTFAVYRELEKDVRIKVINWGENVFNYAKINNDAIQYATGEYLLFLNNDTEIINNDWLHRMIEHCIRPDVGAVGAKLYYKDGTIQHAGVVLGFSGKAAHVYSGFGKEAFGYAGRLVAVQNYSAVTGACLLVRKLYFTEVGGFDERFILAYNDVDLCLKLRGKGLLIVWTPYAEIFHYESKSRGYEDTQEKLIRYNNESSLLRMKWGEVIDAGDPYYNVNLSIETGDFSIKS